LIDGSKSVGKRNFYKVKLFLQDFLSRVDVGPSRVHVSVIQFSDSEKTSIEVALSQYTTVEDLVAAVAKIMYQAGNEADLFNALRLADLMVRFCTTPSRNGVHGVHCIYVSVVSTNEYQHGTLEARFIGFTDHIPQT
jgi:hypothetical protein